MTLYAGQVLRVVQATGETTSTYLTVDDTNSLMSSRDTTSSYGICGIPVIGAPVLDQRTITGTLLNGAGYSYEVAHFTTRGKDFYILPSDTPPESIATVATSVSHGVANAFSYLGHNMTIDDEDLLAGKALVVTFTGGIATSTGVGSLAVSDDDALIQFNGQNGAPNSEAGLGAEVLLDRDLGAFGFNATDGATQMVLVRVSYHAATGDSSFQALRYTVPGQNGALVYYIPRLGSVDLATVLSYTSETLLATSANGLRYADFGLSTALTTTNGTGGANYVEGDFVPNRILGAGGNDTLVGGMGADLLDGGKGGDILHGGSQNDTLVGGGGNDNLFGGNDRDSMLGGIGNDTLTGNWGNDSLFGGDGNDKMNAGSDNDLLAGGAGNDILFGYEGDDTLNDGSGADLLTGGNGADRFVFGIDGANDRIQDFQDGTDLIDLTEAFAALTITTLSPGHVQILHSGEVLLVNDTTGLLTAASFTVADFV